MGKRKVCLDPRAMRRRVVVYVSCPECDCWSVGVLGNGRIVRHSFNMGCIERDPRFKTPLCAGSGKLMRAPVTTAKDVNELMGWREHR